VTAETVQRFVPSLHETHLAAEISQ
jgi:hypothetical protein